MIQIVIPQRVETNVQEPIFALFPFRRSKYSGTQIPYLADPD